MVVGTLIFHSDFPHTSTVQVHLCLSQEAQMDLCFHIPIKSSYKQYIPLYTKLKLILNKNNLAQA